ncbi:16S rRNA (uracil(1498)-N(3))-methyltransferase [Campylobacter sp. FMV-PI01]|uniref:Ribosomal RNA small subunit methyltransferase E n=1 Tax=Campylobacter portucalensis TaxID=2608384 RepID=A0A6L5WH44_9BACT|nr:16S rRNA (uracil(1498)-N(3))-methyltransferase [Campylobacter portucalensis]MSN95702.1 16S rRNA (uracil(1498)-N(3))-methyltransferase [Campylobacter portucalensis]
MVFLYSKFSGDEIIGVNESQFKHLKARRLNLGDRIDVRNLKDGYNYIYEIKKIDRKKAFLELVFKHSVEKIDHFLTLAWAVVDPNVIEKTLPYLNEMGVGKLILVYSDFSQRNFKFDTDRMERILISSSQQCGRNSVMETEIFNDIDQFISKYNNVALIDFDGEKFKKPAFDEIFFIGPEGGFSDREKQKFRKKYALNLPYILRSNTAILSVASKVLL